jgi:putative methyltransferase (TIGR04325 family)
VGFPRPLVVVRERNGKVLGFDLKWTHRYHVSKGIVGFAKNWRRRRREFTGDWPTWSAAASAANGLDTPNIVEKIRVATIKVKEGTAYFERDSVTFYHPEFRWPLLANLLHVAARKSESLHVVDFGGSLGSVYFQHRRFFDTVRNLKWSIVEQDEYLEVGRREFRNDTLDFFPTIEDCAKRGRIDIVLFCGCLQCLEDPYRFLLSAAKVSDCIVIDRTPFLEQRSEDRITIQRPPPSIYGGSIPHRFFAKEKFDNFMTELGFAQFVEWPGFDEANIPSSYVGRVYYANHGQSEIKDQFVNDRRRHNETRV